MDRDYAVPLLPASFLNWTPFEGLERKGGQLHHERAPQIQPNPFEQLQNWGKILGMPSDRPVPVFLTPFIPLPKSKHLNCPHKRMRSIFPWLFPLQLFLLALLASTNGQGLEPAVRVVRFQVNYPDAELDTVRKLPNWAAVMRKSVLASLRFVNKHWLICGEAREPGEPNQPGSKEKAGGGGTDCGKLQVTGEQLGQRQYRLNSTFIANRDPVRNAKVEANSTVQSVLQIGLKGGIFQYTNAMKVLGKPNADMSFEEAFFCYPDQEQVQGDKCTRRVGPKAPAERQKRAGEENVGMNGLIQAMAGLG